MFCYAMFNGYLSAQISKSCKLIITRDALRDRYPIAHIAGKSAAV